MTRTAPRGWLIAALVLAVALLVTSIAVVAINGDRSGWTDSQGWMSGRSGSSMTGGADWDDVDSSRGRAGMYEDCQDLMRERVGR